MSPRKQRTKKKNSSPRLENPQNIPVSQREKEEEVAIHKLHRPISLGRLMCDTGTLGLLETLSLLQCQDREW